LGSHPSFSPLFFFFFFFLTALFELRNHIEKKKILLELFGDYRKRIGCDWIKKRGERKRESDDEGYLMNRLLETPIILDHILIFLSLSPEIIWLTRENKDRFNMYYVLHSLEKKRRKKKRERERESRTMIYTGVPSSSSSSVDVIIIGGL
jgi:hypothetical protein